MTQRRLSKHLVVPLASLLAGACGDSGIPDPQFANAVDTAVVYALQGTPIGTSSGYDVANALVVRLELGSQFDFAFDIDSAGAAMLLPSSVLGRPTSAGLLRPTRTFDDLDEAPLDGYVTDSLFPLSDGAVFVARSRSTRDFCSYYYYGALPRYGKFRVLELNLAERWVRLETLVNLNCGYRGLEEGIPTR